MFPFSKFNITCAIAQLHAIGILYDALVLSQHSSVHVDTVHLFLYTMLDQKAVIYIMSTCSYCISLIVHYAWPEGCDSLIVHYAWPEGCDLWYHQLTNMTPPHQLKSRERGDFKENAREIEPVVPQKLQSKEKRDWQNSKLETGPGAAQSVWVAV